LGVGRASEPPALEADIRVRRPGWLEASVVNRSGALLAYGQMRRRPDAGPLAPEPSPGRSWGGAVGGVVVTALREVAG